MKLQRTFVCITGALFAVGFAASQASAGTGDGRCNSGGNEIIDMVIEINALRAGGKTVNTGPNSSVNVTAKARIQKGSALPDQTIDTTLLIEVFDDANLIGSASSAFEEIRLGVGKGGQGLKLPVDVPSCSVGSLDIRATFFGTDDDTDPCTGIRSIRKICQ